MQIERIAALCGNPFFARRRRDSNPRAPEGKRISSAPRYDRFDTTPYLSDLYILSEFEKYFKSSYEKVLKNCTGKEKCGKM